MLRLLLLNVLSVFLFAFLDIPVPKKLTATDDRGRNYLALLKTPRIAVARALRDGVLWADEFCYDLCPAGDCGFLGLARIKPPMS